MTLSKYKYKQGVPSIKIELVINGLKIKSDPGQNVLECALKNKIDLSHSCGGMGSCGTCRIFVKSSLSHLPIRNEIESEMAKDRAYLDHERLACQIEAYDGIEIEIPKRDL